MLHTWKKGGLDLIFKQIQDMTITTLLPPQSLAGSFPVE